MNCYHAAKVFFWFIPTKDRQGCVSADLCNSVCRAESGRVSRQYAMLVCPVQIIYTNTGINHSPFTVFLFFEKQKKTILKDKTHLKILG